jgi:hypothetical protein
MKDNQTIDLTKIRFAAPWAAWWAMFSAVVVGVWYLRGAKEIGEQVVAEVKELRAEMRQTRDTMHLHDVRISTLEEWRRSQR